MKHPSARRAPERIASGPSVIGGWFGFPVVVRHHRPVAADLLDETDVVSPRIWGYFCHSREKRERSV